MAKISTQRKSSSG
ncbi:hypothetical protein M6B38_114710 [Iris pallida]|uniref:Uncharacterized protein n=1 Tax=Iris pallida TaxID=29817 RepID=A0AAX6IBS0_IRIPA|nr:hypothetical protein M6B38_114710 [Iris pallida]